MISLRYRPLIDFHHELNRMRSQLDDLFASDRGSARHVAPWQFPLLNSWETGDSFYVEAELPGLELEDLEIYMADASTLAIKGHRKGPEMTGGHWHRRERAFGTFERSFKLPGAVNGNDVEASLKHGVLTIRLPKAAELRPRRIEVKAS
jgi:HSP20 family protein